MTELDEALEIARQDPSQANFFYDALLNAALFIPVQREGKQEGSWTRIKETERFYPLYLTREEERAVPVFDSLEKLQTWANPRAFDYLVLRGHLFIKVIAPSVDILLNEGTLQNYHLTARVLELLRQNAKPVSLS